MDGDSTDVVRKHLDLTGVNPDAELDPEAAIPSRMARAERSAPAALPNMARKPSPVVFTSRPRKRSNRARTMRL